MSVEKRRSRLWFLMPVIFGLIGTAIAYFVLRDDDPKLAKNCLYLGLVLFGIGILTTVVFKPHFLVKNCHHLSDIFCPKQCMRL